MATLQIDCVLTESQMNNIVNQLSEHLSQFEEEGIRDYEDEKEIIKNISVFVQFEALTNTIATLQGVSILDSDAELLEEDSAVLKSRLKLLVNDYNDNLPFIDGWNYEEERAMERYYNKKYGA